MNLTWHIVKKDLRALKWPLLLWALVIVAKLLVGVMLLTADGTETPEWFTRMDGLSKVLASFECMSLVLVAALVQEDLLVGTKSFWVTRPISGARLLSAKIFFIGLVFLLLPLLLTLPWWLWCGYGLREIGWAALETSAIHAACVLLGLLWAVVTDGFARFLMWTLVTLFAIPTLTGTIAYYATRGHPGPSGELVSTRIAVGIAIAVVAILAVVVHQYLTRKTVRSIGIIATTAALIIAVGVWWPWNWKMESRLYSYIMQHEEGKWKASAEPAGLNFTLKSAQLTQRQGGAKGADLHIKYGVEGLAESQALLPGWTEQIWRWADGTTRKGSAWSRSSMAELISEKALGVAMKTASVGQYADTVTTLGWVPADVAARLMAEPPAYTLPARLQLMRFDSVLSVPLQRGAKNLTDDFGEQIVHVEKSGEDLLVTFIRHHHSFWVNYSFGGRDAPGRQLVQYLLVNQAHTFVDRGRSIDRRSTRIASVDVSWTTMSYHASSKAGGPRPVLEAINALNDAELVKVTFVEQARFTHELKADPLVFEPAKP